MCMPVYDRESIDVWPSIDPLHYGQELNIGQVVIHPLGEAITQTIHNFMPIGDPLPDH